MNSSVRFSVIMPCYNSESYVRTAVESILTQTYPDWELIAVNDGSTDSTPDILAGYSKSDDRIKVYSKPNGGYVSAVNFGLDRITGDYFLTMGSDDRLDENLFKALTEQIPDELPDCISFLTERVVNGHSDGLDLYTDFHSVVYENNISLREMREKHPKHTDILFVRDTSKCFRTEKLEGLRYFGKYGLEADGIFSMLFCHRAASFLCIPVVGYYWTLREGSVSGRKPSDTVIDDMLTNWMLFFDETVKLESSEITKDERAYLTRFIKTLMDLCADKREYKKHRKTVKAAAVNAKRALIRFSMIDDHADIRRFVSHPALFAARCRLSGAVKKLLRR